MGIYHCLRYLRRNGPAAALFIPGSTSGAVRGMNGATRATKSAEYHVGQGNVTGRAGISAYRFFNLGRSDWLSTNIG